ncbi:hypothetical protein NDU88_000613 [Pleurodeles waltl]|uniref:Uncharacterized protein n=1 Tax=Pleurodeles waltl TaxID=8319 RepID=A0AAV7KYB0_PLEWA|nr:hypothetical protein NDU88_000613 [Pleurodeles waltl]
MCADFGKEKTFQTRSSGAARILCFLQRLFHWLHCCGVHTCWRASVRRMPPKGVKAALSAGRGKPQRISTTTRQGTANEVKCGSGEKTSNKPKNTLMDRFFEKRREGVLGETGMIASLLVCEQPVLTESGTGIGPPCRKEWGDP